MKILLIILFLIPLLSNAQSVRFKIVKVETKIHGAIRYPVVKYHNKKIAEKINAVVASELLGVEILNDSIFKARLCAETEYLYDLHHTVTYNKNHILSFNVYVEGCGAYCSSSYVYFNFDLATGEKLAWFDLVRIEKKDTFEQVLKNQIRKELSEYSASEMMHAAETDSSTYLWVKDAYETCLAEIEISGFAIYPDRIEYVDECYFQKAITNFGPGTIYPLSLNNLATYLKPRFISLFSKK